MKQKQAFTLIELLVVIVIIGILATISTATFSDYLVKARDAERQTFVSNANKVLLASQVESGTTADYRMGATTVSGIETAFKQLLADQGYGVPAIQNGLEYYLILNSEDIAGTDPEDVASKYILFSCKEETQGEGIASESSLTRQGLNGNTIYTTNYEFQSSGYLVPGQVSPLYNADFEDICSSSGQPKSISGSDPYGSGTGYFIPIDNS